MFLVYEHFLVSIVDKVAVLVSVIVGVMVILLWFMSLFSTTHFL